MLDTTQPKLLVHSVQHLCVLGASPEGELALNQLAATCVAGYSGLLRRSPLALCCVASCPASPLPDLAASSTHCYPFIYSQCCMLSGAASGRSSPRLTEPDSNRWSADHIWLAVPASLSRCTTSSPAWLGIRQPHFKLKDLAGETVYYKVVKIYTRGKKKRRNPRVTSRAKKGK